MLSKIVGTAAPSSRIISYFVRFCQEKNGAPATENVCVRKPGIYAREKI